MNRSSDELYLENIYNENIDKMKNKIILLLNNNYLYNLSKYNIKNIHEYLISARYALGGFYPDDECVDQAVAYGNHLFDKIYNEIKTHPRDLIEDFLIYIEDHRDNYKCSYCSSISNTDSHT